MISVIDYDYNSKELDALKVPVEIKSIIKKYVSCPLLFTKFRTNIAIMDRELSIIKTIDAHPLDVLHYISISNCKKYIVGSNDTMVCIWNIITSELVQTIDVTFIPIYSIERDGPNRFAGTIYKYNGEPRHAFSDNELLIACNLEVKSYKLENNQFINNYNYQIPSDHRVVIVSTNKSNNTFACGTIHAEVFVFKTHQPTPLHRIDTFWPTPRLMSSDHYFEITAIALNKNIMVVSSVTENNIIVDLDTMNTTQIQRPIIKDSNRFITNNYMLMTCNTKFIGTVNGNTHIWDVNTGNIIESPKKHITKVTTIDNYYIRYSAFGFGQMFYTYGFSVYDNDL